jgi:GTP-binding protein
VLVLDASESTVVQDARIAGHILERHRACVVALNKWDLVSGVSRPGAGGDHAGARPPHEVQADIEHALRFLNLAEPVRVSALRNTGLRHLFRAIRTAHRQYTRSIATADLNRVVQIIARHTPPPARGRSPTKVHYGVQTGTRPPAFRLFTNHPDQVREEYTRFMEHQLRYHFGFAGTPVRIEWSGREGAGAESPPPTRPQGQPARRKRPGKKPGPGRTTPGRGRSAKKGSRKPVRRNPRR